MTERVSKPDATTAARIALARGIVSAYLDQLIAGTLPPKEMAAGINAAMNSLAQNTATDAETVRNRAALEVGK